MFDRSHFSRLRIHLIAGLIVVSSLMASQVVLAAAPPASTTTQLAITSGGQPVSPGGSIASGSVVTVTATVMAGATAVTPGQVNFCDASAILCTDIHLLGTAQLTSAGTATLKFRPGAGSHSYKTVFLGTNIYAGSSSSTSALSVTGGASVPYPTTTTITQSGYAGDYTLTATVNGQGPVEPTGTVSFLDTSNGNTVLGSASLAQWSPYLNWVNTQSPATSTDPVSVAVGDFNGDGIPDLAVASVVKANVTILLGNGDGTFTAVAAQPTTGNSPSFIAVGDFNGDGIPDLVTGNLGSSTVSIFLGNGDGTFATGQSVATGSYPESIAVGDFNGDGIADLAIANTDSNNLTILLGNGDGTFTAAASPVTGDGPISVVAADFNGDGILDLAVTNKNSDTITILMGDGDGTFTPAASPLAGYYPISIAAADFNRDGKPDLAVANENSYAVTILLGNGDGTFTNQAALYTGGLPSAVGVGDFNGDGVADLVVANYNNDTLSVFRGVGDGTFTAQSSSPTTGGYPWSLAVADFNGDGTADVAVANQNSADLSIFISQNGQSGSATVYNVIPTGAGPHLVDASYPGDSNYASSTSATTSLAVLAATPVISPASGTYTTTTSQTITITDTTPGAMIYYSASGTVSTNGYVPYTGPIAVPPSSNGYEDITTYATATGYSQSSWANGYFTITLPPVAAPTISPASGTYTTTTSQAITITDTTPGAAIYYSASGTVSTNGYVPYTGPITVPATAGGYEYINAYATATGYSQSSYTYANYTITLPPVTAPVISPASGTYTTTTSQAITITDTTPGAMIYYSASGTVSTNGYVPYTGPIAVPPSANGYEYITAYATATGYSQSSYIYANYTITLPPTTTPVITPASGTYTSAQTIAITDTVPGATIYYSASGAVSTSGYVPYTGPITVPASANGYEYITAYATATGYSQSSYANANYQFTLPPAATPVISPASGTYTSAQTVTITDSTPGATLYYEAYGMVNTSGFVAYAGPITLPGEGYENIQAYATATGYSQSSYASATITLSLPPSVAPVISLASGSYSGAQTVTITDSMTGAAIYYTTNGATPTISSAQYTGPITVSASETLVASALANGYSMSPATSAQYFIAGSSNSFIYTVAGDYTSGYSGDGGPATAADLNYPTATALDSAGNFYIADANNNVIRKVTTGTGVITTFAGTGIGGYSGDNGPATSAQLFNPQGVALDSNGNLYIADSSNSVIRMVSATTGVITTFAGNEVGGCGGDNGPAISAGLVAPTGIAFDSAGNLYIDNPYCSRIRKIAAGTGTITTVAGNGQSGYSGDNGPATSAELDEPGEIAVDLAGNLYIADTYNNIVRKVNAQTGVITTVAGTPPANSYGYSQGGYSGDGGPATSATLDWPSAVAVDGAGNIYIADSSNFVIRKVTAGSAIITTVAGHAPMAYGWGGDGGPATDTFLYNPKSVSLDSTGNLYITDSTSRVRELTVTGVTPSTAAAAPVFSVSAGTYASPQTVTLTDTTPGAAIYVTMNGTAPTTIAGDYHGPINVTGTVTIQAIAVAPGYLPSAPVSAAYIITSPPTAVISTVAGNGTEGNPGVGMGGPATSAEIGSPQTVALDAAGNLYFSDSSNNVVWMVSATTGIISIVAGNGTQGYSGDNGLATNAQLESIYGLAVDSAGNLYISDENDDVVRKVTASTGVITTIAGVRRQTYSSCNVTCLYGDGGLAASAYLAYPQGLAIDSAGNLYIADNSHYVVRMVSASTGNISTFAGNGQYSYSGDGGPATSAGLRDVEALAVDSAGNLYISSQIAGRIRKVTASTGIITTIAGNGNMDGSSGDGGLAINAEIYPAGIAVDSAGNLYISNSTPSVREVSASTGMISTVAGSGYCCYGGDGGSATVAEISGPQGIALDATGNLYFADAYNYRVRKVTFPGPATTPLISLASGNYFGSQSVTISDSITGASIYYTTDGTAPSTASNLYSGTITVSASETLQAIAVAAGYTQSATASSAYTISPIVAQTITFTDSLLATATYSANLTYPISATGGGSSNPVTFAVSGPATLSSGTLTITGAGTITITANQAASAGYAAATPATQSIQINPSPNNPVPVISGFLPAYTSAGGAAFTLTVSGSAFTANSTVNWGSAALATTYVSSSQLTAQVTASQIATAGIYPITVQTPAPGGGVSSALQFEVDSAGSVSTAPTITTVTATVTAGSPASYTVTFPSTVTGATVSCLNLPAGATCTYSAGLLTIATSATTPTGTYQITVIFTETVTGAAAAGILLPILLLPLIFLRKRLAARGAWTTACLGLVLLAGAAIACVGCGGGGSSTKSQQTHQVSSSSAVSLTVK